MKNIIDLNNLTFVPANTVNSHGRTGWVAPLLDKIPVGQALVLNSDNSQYATIKNAIRRYATLKNI